MAEGGPADRLHTLLLAMTGRVDDDAVNSAREMLGIGQLAAAAELVAGCLLAGRIPVSSAEQRDLGRVLQDVQSKRELVDRLHVAEVLPTDEHRFSEQNRPDSDVADALQPVAGRLDGVRALWCAWRVTPAGVTYGAVPRRVLLAEVGAEGSVTAVGYQILEAMRRAGISCSVDVFHTSTDLPEYHRKALAVARRVHVDTSTATTANGANHARAPRASSGGESSSSAGGSDLPAPAPPPSPDPVEPRHTEPAPVSDAETTLVQPVVDAEIDEPATDSESTAKRGKRGGTKNARVPAAVDAKLTDRERNLLRKLHEELAQREQDRGSSRKPGAGSETRTESTSEGGTGDFPSIGAGSSGKPNVSK